MKLFKNLPLYEATIIDENCGVFKVSLVTDPATEVDFVAFDENKPIVKFAVDNKVEHMVSGVIMLANSPIYRRTVDNFEYYITYSPDTIKMMAEKMIFDGVGSNVNIQHQDGSDVDGVNLTELYIIDREKGIAPDYFKDVPNGSLIGTYKVHNPDVWAMIENGEVLSFSLEGVFQVEEMFNKQEVNKENNKEKMKINRIKEMLKRMLVELGEVSTDKAVIIFDGDELEAGMEVHTIDEEGNEVALEDGDYKTEDSKIIVIANGKVVEIKDDEAEVATDEPAQEENPSNENMDEENPASEDTDPANDEPATDEKDAKIAELEAKIAELEAENAELKAKVEELEKEPAAPSAEEAFEKVEKQGNTPADKLRNRGYKF